jgi:hypothetical protein
MEIQNFKTPQIHNDLWKLTQQKWSRDAENTVRQVLNTPGEDTAIRGSSYDSNDPFANISDRFVSSIPGGIQDSDTHNSSGYNRVPSVSHFSQIEDRFERSDELPSQSRPEPVEESENASAHRNSFDRISQRIQSNPGFAPVSTERSGENQPTSYFNAIQPTQQTGSIPKSIQRQGFMMNAVDGVMNFVSTLFS